MLSYRQDGEYKDNNRISGYLIRRGRSPKGVFIMFGELNKTSYQWKVDGKDFPFKKLSEYDEGDILTARGFFINSKGKYKPHPVAILDNAKVDLPDHLTDIVIQILEDVELCKAVDNGKCLLEVYTYDSKQRKNCYSVRFLDAE